MNWIDFPFSFSSEHFFLPELPRTIARAKLRNRPPPLRTPARIRRKENFFWVLFVVSLNSRFLCHFLHCVIHPETFCFVSPTILIPSTRSIPPTLIQSNFKNYGEMTRRKKKNFPTVVTIENSWCREFAFYRGMISREGSATCACVRLHFIAFYCYSKRESKGDPVNPLADAADRLLFVM